MINGLQVYNAGSYDVTPRAGNSHARGGYYRPWLTKGLFRQPQELLIVQCYGLQCPQCGLHVMVIIGSFIVSDVTSAGGTAVVYILLTYCYCKRDPEYLPVYGCTLDLEYFPVLRRHQASCSKFVPVLDTSSVTSSISFSFIYGHMSLEWNDGVALFAFGAPHGASVLYSHFDATCAAPPRAVPAEPPF